MRFIAMVFVGLIGSAWMTIIVAAGVFISAIIGAAFGAIGGEILDHIPYLKLAIPNGIGYLAAYLNPEAVESARAALLGNLDKVGAALGFIGGFFKSALKCEKKK